MEHYICKQLNDDFSSETARKITIRIRIDAKFTYILSLRKLFEIIENVEVLNEMQKYNRINKSTYEDEIILIT